MTQEPLPPLPQRDSRINAFYKSNKDLIDKLLATFVWPLVISALATMFHFKQTDIEKIVNQAKDISAKNTQVLANSTADPIATETVKEIAASTKPAK